MKQKISDMKNEFLKSLDSLKLDINKKLKNINDKLVTIKSGFKENLDDLKAESLSKIEDSIIKPLCQENSSLHQKIEKLESHISVLETDLNKHNQYNRRYNLDIQGILHSVPDNQLEEKVTEIFIQINVKIKTFAIEDCHRMGMSKKITIVRFANGKKCKVVLQKKVRFKQKIGQTKIRIPVRYKDLCQRNCNSL